MRSLKALLVGFIMIVAATSAVVAQYDVPEIVPFTPSTPALASEVNNNFSELVAAVNSNDARIVGIESASIVSDINGVSGSLNIVPGANITVSPDVGTKTVTISANNDGGDAQTLDGINGASYLRSDVADTFGSNLSVTGTLTLSNTLYMYNESLYLASSERLYWDSTNTRFYFTDDLKVQYNLEANYIYSVYDITAADDLFVTDYLYFGGSTAEYIKFNPTATRFDISDDVYVYGNVAVTGELNQGTGTANMMPVAYAMISDSTAGTPSVSVSSGNVSVVHNLLYSRYEITISGHYFTYNNYVVVGGATSDNVTTFSSVSGKLLVFLRDMSGGGSTVKSSFYFVVYKP